jgi:hypothetical protein
VSGFILKTPVAFIIFNRPDTTLKVFEEIRKAKPQKLLVIADGPRPNKEGEAEKCEAARAIIDTVDWDCEVLTNYSDVNLGCKVRVSSGLDWVFETVEEAIILEDDCLPHQTFFRFCQELLEKYRDDERVMQVSGTNFLTNKSKSYLKNDYYFSDFGSIWGWATWKRAWNNYDVNMLKWGKIKNESLINDLYDVKECNNMKIEQWESVANNKLDTWDYQWGFAKRINSGLSVVPRVNLISNIGFGNDATHTTNKTSNLSQISIEAMSFPLMHQDNVLRDIFLDKLFQYEYFKKNYKRRKIKSFIIKFLKQDTYRKK